MSHDEAPTLKQALDPALWFPDAEIVPTPPTANDTATAASTSSSPSTDSTDGSAETGGLYYTTSHPQLHPIAPIAEAVAPMPCAYTPPDIAPLMDVDDIKRAMESVIVDEEDDSDEKAEDEKVVEVKGLEELLEDVRAEEEEEQVKKESALIVST